MNFKLKTASLDFSYTESQIESSVLWESHCHAQYEIIAVLEGDVSIILEGQNYRLTEHQTIIIPPLQYHALTANKQGMYRRVAALFDMVTVPPVLRSRFSERVDGLMIFPFHGMDEITGLCDGEKAGFYEPLIQSLMIRAFYSVLQAKQAPEAEASGDGDEFLRKVIRYIDGHLREKIRLDDLATHTARSKSSVCHLFEEKMGISPKQYILQKKLALANKLIRDGMPPTVAAMQIGYQNYSTFYRIYRKYFGESPSKERAGKDLAGEG